jgi:hypothetical protein
MQDLLQYCETERQAEILKAVIEHGSNQKASFKLGIARQNVDAAVKRIKKLAAIKGWSPEHDMTRPVPDAFVVRGVSPYYDKDGKASGQWVKSKLDDSKLDEVIRNFVESLAQDIKGLAPLTPAPKISNDSLMCVYPMGDPHFGMYAWWQDAGDDFDLDIAERLTCNAVDRLIQSSPDADTGLLLNLGDMFHADNQSNSSKSGHQLDVDGALG